MDIVFVFIFLLTGT